MNNLNFHYKKLFQYNITYHTKRSFIYLEVIKSTYYTSIKNIVCNNLRSAQKKCFEIDRHTLEVKNVTFIGCPSNTPCYKHCENVPDCNESVYFALCKHCKTGFNNIYAVYMQYIYSLYAVYMQYICNIYAVYMQYICSIYAVYMQYICSIYAVYMQYICSIYAYK